MQIGEKYKITIKLLNKEVISLTGICNNITKEEVYIWVSGNDIIKVSIDDIVNVLKLQ